MTVTKKRYVIESAKMTGAVFRIDYSWYAKRDPKTFDSVHEAREFARNTFNWSTGQLPLTDEELDDLFVFPELSDEHRAT